MIAPDAFTRWAESHAIPREYWHLCRQAWDAGAHDRQFTIASHLCPSNQFHNADQEHWWEAARRNRDLPTCETDAIGTTGGKVTTAAMKVG